MAEVFRQQTVFLHRDAPPKPAEGQSCNGCGVCCALETCPLARLRFWRKAGPCPALEWSDSDVRYRCGLLTMPRRWMPWLGWLGEARLRALCGRWIAAGQGCDCAALSCTGNG